MRPSTPVGPASPGMAPQHPAAASWVRAKSPSADSDVEAQPMPSGAPAPQSAPAASKPLGQHTALLLLAYGRDGLLRLVIAAAKLLWRSVHGTVVLLLGHKQWLVRAPAELLRLVSRLVRVVLQVGVCGHGPAASCRIGRPSCSHLRDHTSCAQEVTQLTIKRWQFTGCSNIQCSNPTRVVVIASLNTSYHKFCTSVVPTACVSISRVSIATNTLRLASCTHMGVLLCTHAEPCSGGTGGPGCTRRLAAAERGWGRAGGARRRPCQGLHAPQLLPVPAVWHPQVWRCDWLKRRPASFVLLEM